MVLSLCFRKFDFKFVCTKKIKKKKSTVMLTRRKRIGIDSSPKSSIGKNAHLLTKKTMQETANMLSTPPTRRNRFMLGNSNANMMDDSPVLSQETIKISWKWNNDSTPNRPTNKVSKLRGSTTNKSEYFSNLQRLKRNSNDNGVTTSPMIAAEPESHSPKGLYKFQEEMRKLQCYTESDTSCDNNFNDKSTTASDTGYPTNSEGVAQVDNRNAKFSDSSDVYMMDETDEPAKMMSQNEKHSIVDNLAEDLLNDSDFDQMLLTCKMPAQTETCEMVSEPNKLSVKKASSAPEIKASGSTSSGSNWNLVDDFDDLVKDVDFDIDISSIFNASAKFTRHKSMPQQQQKPTTSSSSTSSSSSSSSSTTTTTTATKTFKPQQTPHTNNNHLNRKSFTRHESMPIRSINRPPTNNNNSTKPNSAFSSTQERKCTEEEIAEKRRQAIERLKNRKQLKVKT